MSDEEKPLWCSTPFELPVTEFQPVGVSFCSLAKNHLGLHMTWYRPTDEGEQLFLWESVLALDNPEDVLRWLDV